ncbi:MAG: hypothetical protein ACKVP0_13925 [Pirellulaceae bacterium]
MLRASLTPFSRLFWRRVFVAPVCLCAVAALHAYRVSTYCQTPWKGGGFGMFSTDQSEETRFLRCWKTPVGCMSAYEMHAGAPVAIPKHLAREELRVKVAPNPERLTRLASLLAEGEKAPVVVELWQSRFDAETGRLLAEKKGEAKGTPELPGRTP